jgi:FkbM family methyltransferase
MNAFNNELIVYIKRFIYGKHGEPFHIGNNTVYYIPGTRPTRFKYANSADITIRNDIKQMKYFIENIKPSDFVLDIGGHVGQYAVIFAALVTETGKIVTFEPDNMARKILYANLRINNFMERVCVEDIALSETNGVHSFFSRGGDSMSSLVKSGLGSNASASDVKKYSVKTMKLDDYLGIRGLTIPDWIKIDTEGAEISILKGAKKILKSNAKIICELHPYAWEEFGTSYIELLSIVKQFGKNIKYLDESLKLEDGPHYGAVIIS